MPSTEKKVYIKSKKNMPKLIAKDVTPDLMNAIRRQFDNDSKIRQMRAMQQSFQIKGNYIAAMKIGKQIEELFARVVDTYIQEANEQCERIDINDLEFTEEERKEVNKITLSFFMCCDILETCIMDFNDIIKRKDKGFEFEEFDDISQLAKMVKEKLKMLSESSKIMKSETWGEQCDNMYEMMKNKAFSIVRKHNLTP